MRHRNVFAAGEFKFLATAAHVLDDDKAVHFGHGIIADTTTSRIVTTALPPSGLRIDDHLDLGILRLTDDQATRLMAEERRSLAVSDWDIDDAGRADSSYVFTGYPESRTRVDRRTRTIDLGPMSASCVTVPEDVIRTLGFEPRWHVLGQFPRRRMMNEQGQQVTAPGPWGMSGGPVWTRRPNSNQLAWVPKVRQH